MSFVGKWEEAQLESYFCSNLSERERDIRFVALPWYAEVIMRNMGFLFIPAFLNIDPSFILYGEISFLSLLLCSFFPHQNYKINWNLKLISDCNLNWIESYNFPVFCNHKMTWLRELDLIVWRLKKNLFLPLHLPLYSNKPKHRMHF